MAGPRATELQNWLTSDDLNIDDRGDNRSPGGASRFLVPLLHHALYHNGVDLPAHGSATDALGVPLTIMLAHSNGGPVADRAWTIVFTSAGLALDLYALQFVAVSAVRAYIEEHSQAALNTLLQQQMYPDGYLGWNTQALLLGERFNADAERNAYGRAAALLRQARQQLRQRPAPVASDSHVALVVGTGDADLCDG